MNRRSSFDIFIDVYSTDLLDKWLARYIVVAICIVAPFEKRLSFNVFMAVFIVVLLLLPLVRGILTALFRRLKHSLSRSARLHY